MALRPIDLRQKSSTENINQVAGSLENQLDIYIGFTTLPHGNIAVSLGKLPGHPALNDDFEAWLRALEVELGNRYLVAGWKSAIFKLTLDASYQAMPPQVNINYRLEE